jgi:hypothetical protein
VETPGIANEEEIQAVHKWLRDQPKTFFVEGIRKLVDRWTKCIEKEGDYVEKRTYLFNTYFCVDKLEKQKGG